MQNLETKLGSYASALASKCQEDKKSFPLDLKRQKRSIDTFFTISQG